jgi:hypothetical protein
MSFLSLLEQECTRYFEKEYLSMKELMNKHGIVSDVFGEIGKYIRIKGIYRSSNHKAIWNALYTQYMFIPFTLDEYLFTASNCLDIKYEISRLLPLDVKIIQKVSRKENNSWVGSQLHTYNGFVISYSYNVKFDIYESDSFDKMYHTRDNNESYETCNYKGLLNLLNNNIKIHKKEDFDFVNFIISNRITDITQIIKILSYFDNENMFIHLMKIVDAYKSNKIDK